MRSVRAGVMSTLLVLGSGCGEPKGSDGETTDTGTSDGGVCEIEFEEAAPGTSGTFTVRNDRAQTIYILRSITSCTWEAWQVLDEQGVQVFWNDQGVPTCDALLDIDCIWGCGDGPTTVIKLDPGATWEEAWGYYVWAPFGLTAACVEGSGCMEGSACWVGRAKTSGQLTARLRVSETCDFTDNCDCGGPACLIDGDSLSIGSAAAETVDIPFDASAAAIELNVI